MESSKLTRRQALRTSAVALAGVAMAACQPKVVEQVVRETVPVEKTVKETVVVQPTPGPKGVVTIRVQSGWCTSTDDVDVWTPTIESFNEKNSDVKMELIDADTPIEDLMTSMAGGTAPELFHFYATGDVQTLFSRGVILPIDEYLAQSEVIRVEEDYLPEQWYGTSWEGKVFGVPVLEGGANPAYSWHVRLLDEIGADSVNGPANWQEAISWAKELNRYDQQGILTLQGLDPLDAWGETVLCWTMAFDAPFISDDKRTMTFDHPNWATGVEVIAQLLNDAQYEKVTTFRQQWPMWTGGTDCGFPNGARAMVINGQWQPGELHTRGTLVDQSWQIGYGWLPCLSEGKKYVNFGQSHSLIMPRICKHPDESFRVMEHMCSVDVNLLTYNIRGGFIWSRPLEAKLDTSNLPGMDWFLKAPGQADRRFSPKETGSPIGNEIERLWQRAIEEVTLGAKKPAQALADINAELQKSLDEYWKTT